MPIPGCPLRIAGVGFKSWAIPFHSWAPDVYQGAPSPIVGFLSVGSKAAGFVLLQRLIFTVFLPLRDIWGLLIILITIITLCYGNLGAIPQTNLKRLLGYSGIAQAGYLTLGLLAGSLDGGAAMLYYLAGYLVTNLLAFLVIVLFHRAARSHAIADYAGLARRSPILAAALLIALLSLAGVPPLAGFFGKFLLITSIVRAGYAWVAGIAILNVVTALYYYLLVAKAMYIHKPAQEAAITVEPAAKIVLYACMAAIIALGLFQAPLMRVATTAARSFF